LKDANKDITKKKKLTSVLYIRKYYQLEERTIRIIAGISYIQQNFSLDVPLLFKKEWSKK
jgi:hypothetical protein